MGSQTKSRVMLAMVALVMTSCAGAPYEPSFGYVLETRYPDGIPAAQEQALADGVLTEQEVIAATQASDACVAAVPGVSEVEPFRWVEQDGEFSGGGIKFAEDADRELVIEAGQACYFEYVALIEFAWLDQFYFGEWSEENLRN